MHGRHVDKSRRQKDDVPIRRLGLKLPPYSDSPTASRAWAIRVGDRA
jgi:hypothetical protein